ncbi:MAG: c-type cytochrome [Akkermansia sp.]
MKMIYLLLWLIFLGNLSSAEDLSPVALGIVGDHLIVACRDAHHLKVVDRHSGIVEKKISLSSSPNGLLMDDHIAYVTTGGALGKVEVVDVEKGEVLRVLFTGHTPMSPVKSENKLYVPNRFDSQIAVFDLSSGQQVKTLSAAREPVVLAISPDGKTVWGGNHLPSGASNGEFTAVALTRYHEGQTKHFPLLNGAQSIRGMAMSQDGRYLAITHLLSRYQVPTTQLDRGWMNTNAVSIVDVAHPESIHTILLDDVDRGSANPWAVAFSDDDAKLVVSHAGTHELSIIDFPKLLNKMSQSDAVKESVNKLSYLNDVRRKVSLSVNGARSLTIKGNDIYVAGYFSDNVERIPLDGVGKHQVWSYADDKDKEQSSQRLGERYFNDASLCFQGWQSCASCHPDSRVDGLNWDLLNDGMGNPKNTRTMFLSHKTNPVMTLGIRKSADVAVKSGFKYIQFVNPDEKHIQCVNEYLSSMKEVPSPARVATQLEKPKIKEASCTQCHAPGIEKGILNNSAQRGKSLFKKSGCIECHPHPYFTTKQLCDVGTLTGLDRGKKLIVPSLVEVWRTAPYLHDGRAKTIREAISLHNKDDRRGKTSNLTPKELDDLAEYVRSL